MTGSSSTSLDANALRKLKVAYIMSRFPKITETFILNEMVAATEQGVDVEVFPLRRERTEKMHPEARTFVDNAFFLPLFSARILRDNLKEIFSRPVLWFTTLWTVVRANFGCLRFLTGALAVFPRSVTVAAIMREQRIQHIHAHFASHPAAAAWIIHHFSGIPYSFVAHGSDLHRDRHMLAEKVRDAAFVVAISDYNRRIILDETRACDADKVKVIHCGVDPQDFCPPDNAAETGTEPLSIVCVGTLHEVKGQGILIQAVAEATAHGVFFQLHLVGDGPDLELLTRMAAEAGVSDLVHFEGRCDRQEVIQYLQQADIVAAPSVPTRDGRREGIPVALMEAMAAKVAVVASRLSGIPELVQHNVNGLLTPPGDVHAVAEALVRLSGDAELRARLASAGRQTVIERFSLKENTRALLQEIESSLHHSLIRSESELPHQALNPRMEPVT